MHLQSVYMRELKSALYFKANGAKTLQSVYMRELKYSVSHFTFIL